MSLALAALRSRAELNATIRAFFAARGVLEVETPILAQAGNPDPAIESLVAGPAKGEGVDTAALRWLRTSPEFALKRLLAAGIGDCFELGKVFRAGEQGRRHQPEFTLLEWYRIGADYLELAAEVVALLRLVLAPTEQRYCQQTLSYRALFEHYARIDPWTASDAQLDTALAEHRIDAELSRDDRLHLILTHVIEPKLACDQITIVHDFPPSQAALACVVTKADGRAVAQRFEVYIGRLELANGYQELRDPVEQRRRFVVQRAQRKAAGQSLPPIDERLLAALDAGLPHCAGVALGVDRLLLVLLGQTDLRDLLALPWSAA